MNKVINYLYTNYKQLKFSVKFTILLYKIYIIYCDWKSFPQFPQHYYYYF